MRIAFSEKLAFGLGNFMPVVVTVTGGLAMFFYTDVAGLSAAFVGAMLLAVRLVDAVWDIWVGRRVDATRHRLGQARPYLLWFAPLLALAIAGSFTVPPWDGPARTSWFVLTYVLMWCCYSLIQIPFQALLPLVAPDPEERLRLAGVNSFVQFTFVMGCAVGFPMLKDVLADGNQARGFQLAALVFAAVGLAFTWICFARVRERVEPMPIRPPNLRGDIGALWRSRSWRSAVLANCALGALISLPLSSGVYFFTAVLGKPQLVGPYMGIGGLGLMLGVVLSDQLTRRFCKKRVFVGTNLACAVFLLGFLTTGPDVLPLVFALALLSNMALGVSAPISFSMNGDVADAVELQSGKRVVGTLVATVQFMSKLGGGLASALVGAVLSLSLYQAGATQQPASAQMGILALMSVLPAAVALVVAVVIGWAYPLNRARLVQQQAELVALRQQQPASVD